MSWYNLTSDMTAFKGRIMANFEALLTGTAPIKELILVHTSSVMDPETDGNWKIYNDGTNLLYAKRESGVWNIKGGVYPQEEI